MASAVDVTLILCDAAVADQGGKVHMLGAGWSTTASPTAPSAVAVLMKIPWDRANQRLAFDLTLCDSDGHPVSVSTPEGGQLVRQAGELEVGRPPGIAPGSSLDASLALTIPPLPLQPGRYQWRLVVAESHVAASFAVRPPE